MEREAQLGQGVRAVLQSGERGGVQQRHETQDTRRRARHGMTTLSRLSWFARLTASSACQYSGNAHSRLHSMF